jgi:hypothetical protein
MQELGASVRLKERDSTADCRSRAAEFATSTRQTALVESRDKDLHCIETIHAISNVNKQSEVYGRVGTTI